MAAVLSVAMLAALFVVAPFIVGYFARSAGRALALVFGTIVVLSFAPLGPDQVAPWQDGYPSDGDWRLFVFPWWLLVALPMTRFGSRAGAAGRMQHGA